MITPNNRYMTTTPFHSIYSRFFSKVTDDMYISWTEADTHADVKNILLSAIPRFKHPKFKLFDYDSEIDITDENGNVISQGRFNFGLMPDEEEIFAGLMLSEWFTRQIATVDNTKMKYSTSDFRQSSQANQLDKLLKIKLSYDNDNYSLQKTYNRRVVGEDGEIKTNLWGLGGRV